MTVPQLTAAERDAALAELPDWTLRADGLAIEREFKFGNFSEAWGFMNRVALIAEQRNHHPEWSNVYNRVVVDLTTHDAGAITAKDLKLATQFEQIASKFQ